MYPGNSRLVKYLKIIQCNPPYLQTKNKGKKQPIGSYQLISGKHLTKFNIHS